MEGGEGCVTVGVSAAQYLSPLRRLGRRLLYPRHSLQHALSLGVDWNKGRVKSK